MKIGIITFWESNDNYGQVLQAFALQCILKKLGHTPFQIKYSLYGGVISSNKRSLLRRIIRVVLVFPIIKQIIGKFKKKKEAKLFALIEGKNKVRRFSEFRKENIHHGNKVYYNLRDIQLNPPEADVYITGSDQVWNMSLSNINNRVYYLDFGSDKVKRLSYAASFASKEFPKEYKSQLGVLLSRFNSISVREDEGVEICREVGIKATKAIDPTLLLNKEKYLALTSSVKVPDRFIYIYSINVESPDEISWLEIKKYANKEGLRTIVSTSSGNIPGREIYDGAEYLYATIPEWLSYINNSHVVITTSFHGIAFCLIMHSNFVYFPLQGERSRGNGRVLSMLKSVGLEYKIANKEKSIGEIINLNIDWKLVDRELERQKLESINFLKNSL